MRKVPVRSLGIVSFALGLAVVSWACGGGEPQTASGEIVAAEGGTVTLGDAAVLRIPAGALSGDATVTITRASAHDAPPGELEGGAPVGDGFNIDLGGKELSKPATLEITYDPGLLPENGNEGVVFLAYYDEESDVWVPVGGRVDRDRNVAIIETDHLSWWQPWTWNWDAWIAVLKKTLSLKLSEWMEAATLLTEGCERTGTNASVDESGSNKVIQGCIDKDDPSSPEFRVVNLKSFFLGISPAPDGPGYPPSSLLGPGDAARFTASNSDTPPAVVYADFTEAAMWRFIVGLAARMLPGGDELPNEAIAFIADGLQRVVSASEVSAALEAGDPVGFTQALAELITSEPFIKTFAELASRYAAEHGLDMLKRWTEAGIRQVFLGVAAVDVIGSATDFIFTYVTNNQSAVAFNWTQVKPSRIAYTGADGNIWVMNSDGSDASRLTNDGESLWPTWSPDGEEIAFVSGKGSDRDIYLMKADGSDRRNLTGLPGDERSPTWSSDGGKIAFERFWVQTAPFQMLSGIYVINSDGSGLTRLANSDPADGSPAWSPDGTKIAYIVAKRIWVINVDGSDRRPLTDESLPPTFGAEWSPDGKKIAFSSIPPMGFVQSDIYVVNSDGTRLVRLTDTENNETPAWSPDGAKIAFVSLRDGNAEIYVMNADGSGQTRLTNNEGSDLSPAWQPSPR